MADLGEPGSWAAPDGVEEKMLLRGEVRKLSYSGTGLGDLDSTVSSEVSDAAGELALPFMLSLMLGNAVLNPEARRVSQRGWRRWRKEKTAAGKRAMGNNQCGVVLSRLHLHG